MTYSLTSEPIPPTWYALVVKRGSEEAARQILMRDEGIDYAFFPDEVKSWTVRGKHYTRKRALVAGFVFTRFTRRPLWHVIKERELLHGVMSFGCTPAPIHPTHIKRLQGLDVSAQALREARRQAKLLRVGDKASFQDGPLAGFCVSVEAIDGPLVRFLFPSGLPGETDMANLQKVAAE